MKKTKKKNKGSHLLNAVTIKNDQCFPPHCTLGPIIKVKTVTETLLRPALSGTPPGELCEVVQVQTQNAKHD